MEKRQNESLSKTRIDTLIRKHKKGILQSSDYDLSQEREYNLHSRMIKQIGDNYLEREFREFIIDRHNRNVLRFLLYYFNGCRKAEDVFPGNGYKVHKNLLLVGSPGTGKTIVMQIFADYLKLTGNPNQFLNTSVTEMMNYYKIHGHIDRFTYNEGRRDQGDSLFHVCLNDIGLETENQKSYGTSLDTVIDEFLYARYEIYQLYGKKYLLTSNLSVDDFKMRFGGKLIDRFKSFNVIPLLGESRRI